MNTRWLDARIAYDGSQLAAHWILRTAGIVGDAIVGFVGPCEVVDAEMADLEDLGGPGIRGAEMVHFVMETFDDGDLERAVLRQRLLTAIVAEQLRERLDPSAALRRRGDDLFVGGRKLSISVATRSTVSTLLHMALNVDPTGAPVRAVGLGELGVDPQDLGAAVLDAVAREQESIREARCKVRAKGEYSA